MQVKTPQSDLYERLLNLGWELKRVDFKQGVYIARAENETTGQNIERSGKTPEMAVASVFQFATRANQVRRFAALKKLGAWDTDWLDQKEEIAKAYSQMPPFDEKAVPAWKALAAESKVQADAIRQQITVEVVDDPEPYTTAAEMCEDVHKNKHFKVSRANSQHPVWSVEDNINFRIVHDVLGHCQSGGDFSWRGENLACSVHFPIVSPLAREALFCECIAQTAYRSYYRGFGPQKIGFLSQFLHPIQEKNGEHVWVPHGGLPTLQPSPNGNQGKEMLDQAAGLNGIFNSPGDWVSPQQLSQPQAAPPSPAFEMRSPVMQGFTVSTKNVSPDRPYDPNAFWTPAQAPPLEDPAQDYIGIADTVQNAAKIDTQWQHEDEATQKRAIMNAFRVALLSPRKHLKHNAAHYQAIMHADPSTKATDLWDMLERAREEHNQKLGYPEGSHLAYRKQLVYLADQLRNENGWLTEADALREAKRVIFEKTKEFEETLDNDPTSEGTSELRRYNAARKMVTEWLREHYTPLRGWQPGQMALASAEDEWSDVMPDDRDPWTGQTDAERMEGDYWQRRYELESQEHSSLMDRVKALQDQGRWQEAAALCPHSSSYQLQHGLWGRDGSWIADPQGLPSGAAQDERDPAAGQPGQRCHDCGAIIHNGQVIGNPDWLPRRGPIPKTAADQLFNLDDGWRPVTDATGYANEDSKYGAFMGAHLDAIEQVGQHIDQIRDAALRDLDDGGKGFIFRNAVMNMNLPGVNPKVASFAWLLLAPMTSELGVIDAHVLRGLRRAENQNTVRDYYKHERMQRAAKDATGYSHMPLGLYHWGLWDQIRNPGTHSDHSPLRVLDPLPWDEAKWDAATNARSGPWVGPMQFENGRGHMEQAARDFDREFTGQPIGLVPLARHPGMATGEPSSAYVIPSI